MKTNILHLFTRTPLHVGAGSSVGAVDQPIQRERHTGFPIIPGSSIKGVLRDFFETPDKGDLVFGKDAETDLNPGRAGGIIFSEARLLLFPLRSARGTYALATCPLALSRFFRDTFPPTESPDEPPVGSCLAGTKNSLLEGGGKKSVILEEYQFSVVGEFPESWAKILLGALPKDPVLQGGADRLVFLSDEDFSHFALNTCQVNQHVKIDPKTGTQVPGHLFNEETVPAETLFYSTVIDVSRDADQTSAVRRICSDLATERLVQFGGNASTGLGLCSTILSPNTED